MEYVKSPLQAASSPRAKKTYLGTVLFITISSALLCIAALAYPIFYYNYVPRKLTTVPIHLQYNAGLNPYGVVSLSPNVMLEQAYDVSIELTLPRSPTNLERGNFMIALYALKNGAENPAFSFSLPRDPYEYVTETNVVFSSRRPVLLPYEDPLVSMISRIVFLFYHLLFPQKTTLTVPMGELVEFRHALPLSLLVDVQAGQTLQVYEASVTFVARLSGIRWFMYNHRILAFWVCTGLFWFAEMVSMAVAWFVLVHVLSTSTIKGEEDVVVKDETEYDDDVGPLTSTETDNEPEFKSEEEEGTKMKVEDSDEQEMLGKLPFHQNRGDADDDEDDDDDDDVDPWEGGAYGGTSFDLRKGGSVRRRSSRSEKKDMLR
ncbi:hypothetical protein GGS20DRAFT_549523 [Poronia punctata]|nr:hypothetical protein GGS20DRAFT_549523 [Poronia punctata]